MLGKLAPESVDSLIRLATDRSHKDDHQVRVAFLKALGETKDKKAVKVLTKELDESDARVQAAAAEAHAVVLEGVADDHALRSESAEDEP